MKKNFIQSSFVCLFSLFTFTTQAFTEDLPSANEIFNKMGMGINIGNTMEVPNNPTYWGNKFPTEAYIDSVKAAGFNTIRIPCAWYSHSNAMSRDSSKADIVPNGDDTSINPGWLDSVKTVVDYCMRAGLITILNIHWDNGWLEKKLNDNDKEKVNERQRGFWTQIANKFKDYNENLLFASANEPETDDNNYKHQADILQIYHQTFVDAVRATGSNNESRTLIVQGPSTSIDRSVETFPISKMPKDIIENRLMFEIHYYDPSPYTIVSEPVNWGAIVEPQYYWGEDTYPSKNDVHNCGYNPWGGGMGTPCSTNDIEQSFSKMKINYVDKGVPVIIGEFGANDRKDVQGVDYAKHRKGRIAYYSAIASVAKKNKLCPIAWDTGHEGSNNMTIIRRQTEPDGSIFDIEILNAMRNVYNLGDYVNNGITHIEHFTKEDSPQKIKTKIKKNNHLYRDNNKIISNNNILLYNLNGSLIKSSKKGINGDEIILENLQKGLYIAKSGKNLLKINVE